MNPKITKGIILAGGKGTRLMPMTKTVGKPLLPVYDKPLIYYPLATLISIGVKDILLISTQRDLDSFHTLLGDGSQLGINIRYDIQSIAKGIPDAFVIGEKFIGDDNIVLVLGDNVFNPIDTIAKAVAAYQSGSLTFGFPVSNPEAFGVAEIDANGNVISMEEKPANPVSNLAIIGLYIFDKQASAVAKLLKPSKRGELEILHIIQHYLDTDSLKFENLGKEFSWFDAGNPDSLLEVSNYAKSKTDIRFGSIEIAALESGRITPSQFQELVEKLPKCSYKSRLEAYLKALNQ